MHGVDVGERLVLALCGGTEGEELHGVGERERRQFEHSLTVDVERNLAGTQNPKPGSRVEKAARENRDRVDDVFAIVEDHQGLGAFESFKQRRFAPRDIQRRDERVTDFIRGRRRFEPGQPHAAASQIMR